MGRFIINGGKALSGEISVSGSKNAALPIIFAAITIKGISKIHNVPDISDVNVALDILSSFGAKISRFNGDLIIDSRELYYSIPSESLVSKIRASSYLLGATLARFGHSLVRFFGGCNFDSRPIDMHLSCAEAVGAKIDGIELKASRLCGADIIFDKISVGATVNALIMTANADGVSRIFGYAKEPHVMSLIDYLRNAGADITVNDEYISVVGASLSSAEAYIIPDMIEAGTYINLSLMTGAKLRVNGAELSQLESFLKPLVLSGASFDYSGSSLIPTNEILRSVEIITAPYPSFPTDLQPQCAPLLASFFGGSIREGVWHNRFGYLAELSKFGVLSDVYNGYAKIYSSKIKPACASAPDLRGGAALLLAALAANGESVIENADVIKRGYADVINKLTGIGASIYEIQ